MKTEFGFDVLEVAHGRYAPDSYHDFIGFGVSVPLLEQAFEETYGLDLKTVLRDEEQVLGSYRILKDQPSMTRKKFLYSPAAADGRWQSGLSSE